MGTFKEDLTGKVYGFLTVIGYNKEDTKWVCKCQCGNTTLARGWDLTNNRKTRCSDCKKNNITTRENLDGKVFGEWDVIEHVGNKWLCRCSCGSERLLTRYELTSGHSKSCGHATGKLKHIETGTRFGSLVVTGHAHGALWNCMCDCGKTTVIDGKMLRCKNTQSCGCGRGRNEIDLAGQIMGEWHVISYEGNSYWKCRCSCGTEKNVHSYILRNKLSLSCGIEHYRMDIAMKQFGELTALRPLPNGIWECKCSCGETKNILAANLVNRSTNSCGCKTEELKISTLMTRYEETASVRINNPRSAGQLEIIHSKDSMETFLCRVTAYMNRKPYISDVANILDTHAVTVLKYIRAYELEDLLSIRSGTSKLEEDVAEYIESITDYTIERQDKKVLNGRELDIYIPELRLAIEFNGTYWHSDIYKDRDYHQQKTIDCAKQGIRLIHIFEYEWAEDNTREKLKALLKMVIANSNKVIYARNTELKQVEYSEAKRFTGENHLQNGAKSSVQYGLYYEDELIGCMTFGKPRFNNDYEWELIRLAWKNGYSIVGGAEKLFKAFVNQHNPNSIISYCDIAKFTGSVYKKLGFNTSEKDITVPSYNWVSVNNEAISRYKTQKHKLIEQGLGEENDTENEIMEKLGYFKLHDCGNLRFSWNKSI